MQCVGKNQASGLQPKALSRPDSPPCRDAGKRSIIEQPGSVEAAGAV
jgi:hypothetical protein